VLTGLLFAIFLGVSTFLVTNRYARKETVQGVLEPSAGAVRVSAPRGSTIADVHVREGDHVQAGQPIATLNLDASIGAEGRLGEVLRLETDLQSDAMDERAAAVSASMARQIDELSLKADEASAKAERLGRNIELQKQRVLLSQSSFEAARSLSDQGFVSSIQLRQREEAWVSARQTQINLEQELGETRLLKKSIGLQRQRALADQQSNLAEIRAAGAEIREKRASYAANSTIVVTAPRSGVVASLAAKSGNAVAAAQQLAVIVPRDAVLQAELWAPSRAVGFVKPGDPVRIMFDAYPYQRFGVGRGQVVKRADAPTSPADLPVPIETKEALYRITVSLDKQAVDGYGQAWRLAAGAHVSADIVLESRTFAEWMLEPLIAIRRRGEK